MRKICLLICSTLLLISCQGSSNSKGPEESTDFVVSGKITNNTGKDISGAEIIAFWGVVTGSPDYSYVFGKTVPDKDGTFELVFDRDPPAEALNSISGGVVGVAYIVVVMPSELTEEEGVLSEDYDYENLTIGGAPRHCVIFSVNYKIDEGGELVWPTLFEGYGVGKGKEIEDSPFEEFEPVDSNTVEIIIDSIENLQFVNWS